MAQSADELERNEKSWHDLLDGREEEIHKLNVRVSELEDRLSDLIDALHRIASWSDAYPLTIFPEPDLLKARDLLKAGGMTLDSISADCMRHVVEGVGRIAKGALGEE